MEKLKKVEVMGDGEQSALVGAKLVDVIDEHRRRDVRHPHHRAAVQAHGLPWPQGAGKGVRRA